ncbi:MAG TPA: YcaO-like family protein [Pseudonocardiaceae bacterium]|nr:YcaO-like family protein [Pseudonocardiaceae bacterium]
MDKVFRAGTHRVRLPEQTWELIEPLLPNYGVTRVADVTGLDVLGVPVAMAVRPMARTLSVSQGKGQTLLLAKISGAMESIEFWHTEFNHPPLSHRHAPARDLDLPYRIEQCASGPDLLVTAGTPLDWVDAIGLATGSTVPVPAGIVTVPRDQRTWLPPGLSWSTNGLASGNSHQEASLHALYEVIERDAVSRRISGPPVEYVELASVTDPSCVELIRRITDAGATLRITRVPSRFDVPCFGATVWSPEFPVICLGWGAHLDAGVAVSRAVTEAVQSRLTMIAGSRDDLAPIYHFVRGSTEEPPPVNGVVIPWSEAANVGPGSFDDLADELSWVCARTTEVTGVEPLCVDLSTTEEFAVVKVIAPDAVIDVNRIHAVR